MNEKRRMVFVALLVIATVCPMMAQEVAETVTLTVDEAVDYALQNSKTLQSAQIDLEMKTRAKNNAWNVFVPSVQAIGVASRSNEYNDPSASMNGIMSMIEPLYKINGIPFPGGATTSSDPTEKDYWTALGQIDVSLNLSLALIDGIKATKANYEAGLITWEQSVKETERDIRKMFYGLLLQQESLVLQQQSLLNAEERVAQAQINYSNGFIPELSLLQTQVAYENQKPAVLKSEQGLMQQLDLFAFIIGLPLGTNIVLEGEIAPTFIDLDSNNLVDRYLQNRLDIQSFLKSRELLGIQLSATNFQTYTPALALGWGWNPIFMMQGEFLDWEDVPDNGSLSITLAWNLTNMLPFSANRQQARDLKDNIAKMDLQYETVLQNAEMEIHNLTDNLRYSESAIEAASQSIALAQRSYDMTVDAYDQGAAELLDVRDAETQLNQAKLGEMSERYNYLSSLLDLEYALNTKFEN